VIASSRSSRCLLTGVVAAVGILLAGCGDTVSPPRNGPPGPAAPNPNTAPTPNEVGAPPAPQTLAWTRSVCSSLGPVLISLGTPPRPNVNDAVATKQAYATYLTRAREAADRALTELSDVGPPPVPNGQRVNERVHTNLTRLRDELAQAQVQIANFDPNNAASAARTFSAAGNVVSALGSQAQVITALAANPQLQVAVGQTPQCQQLMS
jgi:hypothetical protein